MAESNRRLARAAIVTASVLPAGAPFPRRIGIVMLTALGDVVHTLPLVTAIGRHAPGTHVTWILQPGPAELVRGHPAVDEVIVFERARGWRAFLEMRALLRDRPFDLVLDLQSYLKAGLLTAMTRAPIKLGIDRARSRDLNWLFTTHRIAARPLGHIQDQLLEFLDAIGVPHGAPDWQLGPTAQEQARAREILGERTAPLVGFVVATSKPEKNWMPERYAELALRLHAEGVRVVLLGGTMAIERTAAEVIMRQAAAAQPINALGTGLRTILGLIEACQVVVSSDTGPYHMAVAMNVPAVGLFGFTNPRRVGPYGRFQDLVVDGYGDPGEDYPISMDYRPGRMGRITVDAVSVKVRQALRK